MWDGSQELDDSFASGAILASFASLYSECSEWDKASALYLRALQVFRKYRFRFWITYILVRLCDLHYRENNFKEVSKYAQEAKDLAEENGYYDQLAQLQAIQGSMQLTEEYNLALRMYAAAMTNALRFNCYVLDEVVDQIVENLTNIHGYDYLIEYWTSNELDGKPLLEVEQENRELEVSDAKPCTARLEDVKRQLAGMTEQRGRYQ